MQLNNNLLGEQLKVNAAERCRQFGLLKEYHRDWDPKLTEEEIIERVEKILQDDMQAGNQEAIFQLAQYYFEQKRYDKALHYFEMLSNRDDWQATFQLAVMLYDGLGIEQNLELGFKLMCKVASSKCPEAKHLVRAAQFNLGRAYYQGFGVKRSDSEAERYWLLAADDGNPKASVRAQSTLGLFYSCGEHLDLKKAFYWHSEATGNGSLESQGALGVMYLGGLGVKQDEESAVICFREAANSGNVYAAGHLVSYYYKHKLYTKAVALAAKLCQLTEIEQISLETDCLVQYINKGISMASFYYARCLAQGRGVQKDEEEADKYYSLSYKFDAGVCALLQSEAQRGAI